MSVHVSRSGDTALDGRRIGRVFKVKGGWAAEHRMEGFTTYRLPQVFKRQSDAAIALLHEHRDWLTK